MKYLILDGNNLIFRTWYTASHVAKLNGYDDDRLNRDHVQFTMNSVLSVARKYKSDQVYITWDERRGETNHRKDINTEYKGNRDGSPDPYRNNDLIKELLSNLGVISLFPLNLEADDIIAYICKNLPGQKTVVSVDRDFLQLINKDVCVFDPIRKVEFNTENFEELTGYDQKDWYIAKCLKGDKSDNIIGVKGFGDVTIRKFLDGKIELTEDQKNIVEFNDSVFTLDMYEKYPDEKEFYSDQLLASPERDMDSFLSLCLSKDLHMIAKKEVEWNDLFITTPTLLKLFG
jgi:5'-3' exonuclease